MADVATFTGPAAEDVAAILRVLDGKPVVYGQILLCAAVAEFCERGGPALGYAKHKHLAKMTDAVRHLWSQRG